MNGAEAIEVHPGHEIHPCFIFFNVDALRTKVKKADKYTRQSMKMHGFEGRIHVNILLFVASQVYLGLHT